MAKINVGNVSEIPEGKMTHVVVGEKDILVANVQGKYYATNNNISFLLRRSSIESILGEIFE